MEEDNYESGADKGLAEETNKRKHSQVHNQLYNFVILEI